MNDKRLQAKDFITIGIFTALLFVVEFAFGMLSLSIPKLIIPKGKVTAVIGSYG